MAQEMFAGVDLGSSFTKAVLVDAAGEPVASCVRRTGMDFASVSREVLAAVGGEGVPAVATGVGRSRCFATERTMTEITCLARGSHRSCPREHVVVDIGGQDNKIVHVGKNGRQTHFKMNRKCAAGTGAFLEEISGRLDVAPEKMSALASSVGRAVEIGSYCTVFTCTEIIHHVREGKKPEEILRGCYDSVAKRILEMDTLPGDVVLTGGVIAMHPVVADILREKLGKEPTVPPEPQFVGALGAALLCRESHEKNTAVR